jgi:hypothetical protein
MELTFAHVYSSNPKRARSGELALPASLVVTRALGFDGRDRKVTNSKFCP